VGVQTAKGGGFPIRWGGSPQREQGDSFGLMGAFFEGAGTRRTKRNSGKRTNREKLNWSGRKRVSPGQGTLVWND